MTARVLAARRRVSGESARLLPRLAWPVISMIMVFLSGPG
jgi:hypothetical protein